MRTSSTRVVQGRVPRPAWVVKARAVPRDRIGAAARGRSVSRAAPSAFVKPRTADNARPIRARRPKWRGASLTSIGISSARSPGQKTKCQKPASSNFKRRAQGAGERLSDSGEHRTAAHASEDIDREREGDHDRGGEEGRRRGAWNPVPRPRPSARTPFWLWL